MAPVITIPTALKINKFGKKYSSYAKVLGGSNEVEDKKSQHEKTMQNYYQQHQQSNKEFKIIV